MKVILISSILFCFGCMKIVVKSGNFNDYDIYKKNSYGRLTGTSLIIECLDSAELKDDNHLKSECFSAGNMSKFTSYSYRDSVIYYNVKNESIAISLKSKIDLQKVSAFPNSILLGGYKFLFHSSKFRNSIRLELAADSVFYMMSGEKIKAKQFIGYQVGYDSLEVEYKSYPIKLFFSYKNGILIYYSYISKYGVEYNFQITDITKTRINMRRLRKVLR